MKSLSVLYEDSEILLINKEAGISVQGGAGVSHPLDEELSRQLGYKIHLVHRLDKDTAGILIVAKNPAAAAKWTKLIAGKDVHKEYTAVCIGHPQSGGKEQAEGTLKGQVQAHGRIQEAVSLYKLVKKGLVHTADEGAADGSGSGGIPLSLISISIETGRMHQIRIQTAKAGFPIAGDDQHGDFKSNKILRKAGIKKLLLAATRLTLPLNGNKRSFEVPLPPHIQDAVDRFF